MEDAEIVSMFKILESSGLKTFLTSSVEIYVPDFKDFYAMGSVSDDGKANTPLNEHTLMIDKTFFATLFQLPSKERTECTIVPESILEDMKTKFSATIDPIKMFGKNKEMKMEYQLLANVVANTILAKVRSFDAFTNEKFFVMTKVATGMKNKWSVFSKC